MAEVRPETGWGNSYDRDGARSNRHSTKFAKVIHSISAASEALHAGRRDHFMSELATAQAIINQIKSDMNGNAFQTALNASAVSDLTLTPVRALTPEDIAK